MLPRILLESRRAPDLPPPRISTRIFFAFPPRILPESFFLFSLRIVVPESFSLGSILPSFYLECVRFSLEPLRRARSECLVTPRPLFSNPFRCDRRDTGSSPRSLNRPISALFVGSIAFVASSIDFATDTIDIDNAYPPYPGSERYYELLR